MKDIYEEYFEANPSCIDSLFTGISRGVVCCDSCNYESITYKPFSALSLGYESTLSKSLKKNFEPGQFDSQNKYKCEECEKKTKAKYYSKLCFLPEVFVFHIKRFDMSGRKISKFQEYPKEIDMSQFQNKEDNVEG